MSDTEVDLGVMKRNDSFWYEQIAKHGHDQVSPDQLGSCEDGELKQSYYAFFPLYPFILGLTLNLTGLSFNLVAFGWSVVFSLGAFLLFYRFTSIHLDSEKVAFWSTLSLILFPFHYYFSVFYTEALYLLLLIASFYFLRRREVMMTGLAMSLLVLVRPNGLFMLVPLWVYYLERDGRWNIKEMLSASFRFSLMHVAFLVPVLVFTGYCVYQFFMTGDFFAYKTAQAGWCRQTVFPWEPILNVSGWMEGFRLIYLLMFILIGMIAYKRLPLSFNLLIWINLLLPLVANSITLPRFISTIFVFSMLIGMSMVKLPIWARVSGLFILFVLQLWTFEYWLNSSPFSY